MDLSPFHLRQYRAAMHAANQRYLNALSVVGDPAPAYQQVQELVGPKQAGPRRIGGFNPARREDVQLFRAVLQGDHLVKGFYNSDIRRLLYRVSGDEPVDSPTVRRQRAAVGRQLRKLHVRGLVAKIPNTRRWQVTARGHQLLGTCVQLYYHGLTTAA